MTSGSQRIDDLDKAGNYMKTLRHLNAREPADDTWVQLAEGVMVRDGVGLDVPGFKGSIPPAGLPRHIKDKIAEYWRDPIKNTHVIPSMVEHLLPVSRFYRDGQPLAEQVRFVDERHGGKELHALLKTAQRYGELKLQLSPPQRTLLKHLVLDGMVNVAHDAPPLRLATAIAEPAL
jgi:hypothetical protein